MAATPHCSPTSTATSAPHLLHLCSLTPDIPALQSPHSDPIKAGEGKGAGRSPAWESGKKRELLKIQNR